MHPSNHSFHFALTGSPLGHSLSPLIHNAALQASGLSGSYILRPIPPDQATNGLKDLVQELRDSRLDGLNVTIPHKQAVFRLCDRLTPAARAIGAANLIYRSEGLVWGDNSDALGFLAALQPLEKRWSLHHRRAVVLGAGGSARAVIFALANAGWQVQVAARRLEQAGQLVADLALALPASILTSTNLTRQDFEGMHSADLIVNTTPLGMFPHLDGCPWPEDVPLSSHPVYYDLVYNPRQTRLLNLANSCGAVCIGGITMLIEQAAIAFQRWTGQPAPKQAMFDSVK
jgi:shikimate dehydrogenase